MNRATASIRNRWCFRQIRRGQETITMHSRKAPTACLKRQRHSIIEPGCRRTVRYLGGIVKPAIVKGLHDLCVSPICAEACAKDSVYALASSNRALLEFRERHPGKRAAWNNSGAGCIDLHKGPYSQARPIRPNRLPLGRFNQPHPRFQCFCPVPNGIGDVGNWRSPRL